MAPRTCTCVDVLFLVGVSYAVFVMLVRWDEYDPCSKPMPVYLLISFFTVILLRATHIILIRGRAWEERELNRAHNLRRAAAGPALAAAGPALVTHPLAPTPHQRPTSGADPTRPVSTASQLPPPVAVGPRAWMHGGEPQTDLKTASVGRIPLNGSPISGPPAPSPAAAGGGGWANMDRAAMDRSCSSARDHLVDRAPRHSRSGAHSSCTLSHAHHCAASPPARTSQHRASCLSPGRRSHGRGGHNNSSNNSASCVLPARRNSLRGPASGRQLTHATVRQLHGRDGPLRQAVPGVITSVCSESSEEGGWLAGGQGHTGGSQGATWPQQPCDDGPVGDPTWPHHGPVGDPTWPHHGLVGDKGGGGLVGDDRHVDGSMGGERGAWIHRHREGGLEVCDGLLSDRLLLRGRAEQSDGPDSVVATDPVLDKDCVSREVRPGLDCAPGERSSCDLVLSNNVQQQQSTTMPAGQVRVHLSASPHSTAAPSRSVPDLSTTTHSADLPPARSGAAQRTKDSCLSQHSGLAQHPASPPGPPALLDPSPPLDELAGTLPAPVSSGSVPSGPSCGAADLSVAPSGPHAPTSGPVGVVSGHGDGFTARHAISPRTSADRKSHSPLTSADRGSGGSGARSSPSPDAAARHAAAHMRWRRFYFWLTWVRVLVVLPFYVAWTLVGLVWIVESGNCFPEDNQYVVCASWIGLNVLAISIGSLLVAVQCCRYRSQLVSAFGSGGSAGAPPPPLGVPLPNREGLAQCELDAIPSFRFGALPPYRRACRDCQQCVVCLDPMGPGQQVKRFPMCVHYFHAACLDEWLKRKRTCPLCRAHYNSSAVQEIMRNVQNYKKSRQAFRMPSRGWEPASRANSGSDAATRLDSASSPPPRGTGLPGELRAHAGRHQATSGEHQATSGEHQATSGEHQPTSGEHQPTSGEHQATSGEHKAAAGERVAPSGEHRVHSRGAVGRSPSPHGVSLTDDGSIVLRSQVHSGQRPGMHEHSLSASLALSPAAVHVGTTAEASVVSRSGGPAGRPDVSWRTHSTGPSERSSRAPPAAMECTSSAHGQSTAPATHSQPPAPARVHVPSTSAVTQGGSPPRQLSPSPAVSVSEERVEQMRRLYHQYCDMYFQQVMRQGGSERGTYAEQHNGAGVHVEDVGSGGGLLGGGTGGTGALPSPAQFLAQCTAQLQPSADGDVVNDGVV